MPVCLLRVSNDFVTKMFGIHGIQNNTHIQPMKLCVYAGGHSKWEPQSYHNQAKLQDYVE
jgi:hypothetical protein